MKYIEFMQAATVLVMMHFSMMSGYVKDRRGPLKSGTKSYLIKRKLDNCKPCSGAIPLRMVGEFDIPLESIDREVTKMEMISHSNVVVDIGRTLKPHKYIGMVQCKVLLKRFLATYQRVWIVFQ